MENINKSFPGVQALKDAYFELNRGEVHALVGENGAGKSTLMKILVGAYRKDSGRIIYKGKEVDIPNPRVAQEMGISMVFQELNLMPHLTVAQNIFIGREPKRKNIPIFLDDNEINKRTKELLDMLHLKVEPNVKVSNLSVGKQQMVEIAKALSFNSEVIIFDEPTAALSEAETEELFNVIRKLKSQGIGIIYISHRLEELKEIADRVTVMRDGQYIATDYMKNLTIEKIISMMVGREIYETLREREVDENAEVVLEVRNLKRGKVFKDISFSLRKGEILGFAGLIGAGRTEVARAIFGADPIDSGEIYVKGKRVSIKNPWDAINHRIAYLSEDRKRYGLMPDLDVKSNIILPSMRDFLRALGFVDDKKAESVSNEYVKRLKIRTPSVKQKVKNLSGGNQQKVVVAKWLLKNCDILIFDEPTRGIDVGAKNEIYKLLNELIAEGKSIIMISSELPEILRMSHRIVVMCEGRITGILDANEATEEKILKYATMYED
ncbi:sugar ABC transporter ATP-binding protein [Dictyoglomus thermophilum]|uniref:ABC sugar transporter, ATPase subunit n=2 Tax=Dictyoglomus thermophilum TaxID=14 RepID=B5YC68_DICT6|nr:sugar ABC transporter ATP-binding protein [Dictyoglomus thermophilum]ACI18440.1 ABC sugar transporter, ATPase subunit [Dictyoglomus thermophilum H-6-12]MCX7720055.1 sugar ABC transporter ATP-binding protein [Dictyoglomus thermophilum]